ncbi:hypothetical protein RND81_12G086800 [Saponaria officinalis]|uniref:EF-hand domain-containing protein n=1 Tax=Saponaria officinalis TaxID=3572 RepID=A0AAW1H875_SAPOF
MPSISLSFFSLLNTPISSYFHSTTTTTTHTPTPTSPPPPPPPESTTTTMDVAEIRRVFEMFDQNGDGRITTGELTTSLHNMGIYIPDNDLAQMINHIDLNGDGCVDGLEFESLYKLIMEKDNDHDEEDDIREAFNVFDKNGDGFISVDELRSVLESLGLCQGRNLEDCKLMIMKVDVDGDGRVNFHEFKKMMKQGGFSNFN